MNVRDSRGSRISNEYVEAVSKKKKNKCESGKLESKRIKGRKNRGAR